MNYVIYSISSIPQEHLNRARFCHGTPKLVSEDHTCLADTGLFDILPNERAGTNLNTNMSEVTFLFLD